MDSAVPERPTKRARIACNACKQKKQKCDGNQPKCGNCAKIGRDCTIEDPSSKRHLPPNYIEILESRIAQLERLLHDAHPEIVTDHLDASPNHTQSGSAFHAIPSPISTSQADIQNQRDGVRNSTVADMTDPQQNLGNDSGSTAGKIGAYYGPTSAVSFAKLFGSILGSVRLQGPGMTMSGMKDDIWKSLPKPEPANLPDPIFGSLLRDAYFQHVHPQYPFLHLPTFQAWENDVQRANDMGVVPDAMKAYFVYMVYAIGAAIEPHLCLSSAESLCTAAELLVEHVIGLESLESIQAILCCAMYSMRSSTGVSIWTLSGIALRQCTELGLHRQAPWAIQEPDLLKRQIRRRVFWVSYNLDRIAAISTGRPFGISDEDIDIEMFDDINDEDITRSAYLAQPRLHQSEPSTTVSAAIHNIRVRRIWGDIKSVILSETHTERRISRPVATSTTNDIRSRLKDWLAESPQAPSNSSYPPLASQEWSSMTYHHSLLLLHRKSFVNHARQNYTPSSEMTAIYMECAQSATSLCHTYKNLYLGSSIMYTWGALHILFLAGLTFLNCLWVDRDCRLAFRTDTVSSTCTACTVTLVIMAERWAVARPFRDIFQALANATMSMLAEINHGLGDQEPLLPALSTSQSMALQRNLSGIAGFGICPSIEHLLGEMVKQ